MQSIWKQMNRPIHPWPHVIHGRWQLYYYPGRSKLDSNKTMQKNLEREYLINKHKWIESSSFQSVNLKGNELTLYKRRTSRHKNWSQCCMTGKMMDSKNKPWKTKWNKCLARENIELAESKAHKKEEIISKVVKYPFECGDHDTNECYMYCGMQDIIQYTRRLHKARGYIR